MPNTITLELDVGIDLLSWARQSCERLGEQIPDARGEKQYALFEQFKKGSSACLQLVTRLADAVSLPTGRREVEIETEHLEVALEFARVNLEHLRNAVVSSDGRAVPERVSSALLKNQAVCDLVSLKVREQAESLDEGAPSLM